MVVKKKMYISIDTLHEYFKDVNENVMKRVLSFITFAIIRYMTIF